MAGLVGVPSAETVSSVVLSPFIIGDTVDGLQYWPGLSGEVLAQYYAHPLVDELWAVGLKRVSGSVLCSIFDDEGGHVVTVALPWGVSLTSPDSSTLEC